MNKQLKMIKTELKQLIGQPICYINRAINMPCFHFGWRKLEECPVWSKGKKIGVKAREVADFSLHIQCSFRLTSNDRIIMAANDIFQPKEKDGEDPDFDWDSFEYDRPDNNHFDEVIEKELKPRFHEFVVNDVVINRFGDLKIKFTNGYCLEVIADSSLYTECWRFFVPNRESEHIVMMGTGIEYQ